MKLKLTLPLMAGLALMALACQSPKVYLVRHAEKSSEPANDPHLNAEGQQRALDLAAYFSKKTIDAVYATPFNRTRETVAPLLEQKKISLQTYQPNQTSKIAEQAISLKQHTLIIGHSNTLIPAMKSLGLQPRMEQIADNDYDNLFILRKKKGKWMLEQQTYGTISPANSETATYQMKMQ